MNAKSMPDYLIVVAILGFSAWAFCQKIFVNRGDNANDSTQLLFPVVVPILAGVMVCACYMIWVNQSPGSSLLATLKFPQNVLLLFFSSLGLALAYFLYTPLIAMDPKNISIIQVGNTLCLMVIALIIDKDGHFVREKPNGIEIAGALITLIGVVIMKYGTAIMK